MTMIVFQNQKKQRIGDLCNWSSVPVKGSHVQLDDSVYEVMYVKWIKIAHDSEAVEIEVMKLI